MFFELTEDQEFLKRSAEEVVADLFSDATIRAALDDDEGKIRSDSWAQLVELGWAGVLVPEALGGSGGSVVDACILAEVLAASLAPVPFVGTAIGVASVLAAVGDDAAQRDLAAGTPMALALDGRLRWGTANPGLAFDWIVGAEVVQVVDPATGEIRRTVAEPTGIDRFDQLHPMSRIDDLPTQGTELSDELRRALAITQVGAAAASLGLAAAALREAVAYSLERQQYGRAIAQFQAVQHLCADMYVDVESTRSLAYGAAWAVENEPVDEAVRVAAAATAWCGPAAIRVVETGIQVLGGIGVTWEHDAHLRLRHAQLLDRAFGNPDAAREHLAALALTASEEN